MCTKPDECLPLFRKVLDTLITVGRMADHVRDTVLAEYTELLHEQKHKLRQFDKGTDRLDEFYPDLLKFNSTYSELWSIVKLLLVLSHGQATVERGFSVNRQVCVENLKELSYVSQRVVCDAVEKAGGVLQIPITKELRIAVSAARQRYGAYLEAQKKQDLDASKQRKKHCIEEELDAMKRKKQKLEATIDDLVASADAYAEKAEAENDVTHIVKSNSLRKTAKDKTAELHSIKVQIQQKRLELP